MTDSDTYPDEGTNGDAETMHAFELLRSADPVDHDTVPTADSPQARALLEELVMTTPTTTSTTTGSPSTARRTMLVAAGAGLAAIAVVAGALTVGGGDAPDTNPIAAGSEDPSVAPTDGVPISPGGMAMCVAMYDMTTLAERDFAFEGTLTALDGDQATFDVGEVFAGEPGDEAVLDGGMIIAGEATISVEGPGLQVGDRALVAGDGGFAWGCGFTQAYDEGVASQWRDALR